MAITMIGKLMCGEIPTVIANLSGCAGFREPFLGTDHECRATWKRCVGYEG